MTEDQQGTQGQDAQGVQDAPKPTGDSARVDKVELTPEQYNAMLDRMGELEELALQAARKGKPQSVDELAAEVERRGRAQQPPPQRNLSTEDFDNLTNTQLAQVLMYQIEQQVGQPLLVKLEEMRVADEIKALRNSLGDEDDFDDYRQEIYEVASRNPNLTISQAYKLAKEGAAPKGQKRGDKPGGSEESREKKRDALLSLPARVNLQSERPSHAGGSLGRKEPTTRQDAAKMALDDMEKKGMFK